MRNSNYIDTRIIIFSLSFFTVVFLLSIIGSFSDVRKAVITIIEDRYIELNEGVRDFSNINYVFNNFSEVKKENEKYKEELVILEEEISRLNKQLDDVSFLFEKGLVDFDSEHRIIPVRVLAYEPTTSNLFYINKGTRDEIEKDDVAVLGESLIGKVDEVFDTYAKVRIIGSSELEINVVTLTTNTRGILKRDINGNLQVTEIVNDSPLTVGDIFVTEGKDGEYNYGQYIGKVERIVGSPADPTKVAIIENAIDYFDLSRIFIMKIR